MPELQFGQYWIPQDTVAEVDTIANRVVPSFITTSGFHSSFESLPRVLNQTMSGWNLIVLAVVLLLIVLNKYLYPRQFRQLFTSPFSVSQTNQLLREWNPMKSFTGFTFFFSYIVVIAIFLTKSFAVFSHDFVRFNSFAMFLGFFGLVALWVGLRCLNLYLMNWLFRGKDVVLRQMTVQLSISTTCTLTIFLLLVLLLYDTNEILVWTGICVILLCALARFWAEFVETRVSSKMPPFYIFFYLCTLEIIPVLLLLVTGFRYYSRIPIL